MPPCCLGALLPHPSKLCPLHLQYLFFLKLYGHKHFSRRDRAELAAAQQAVASKVQSGELGPLSPLE